MIIKPVEVAGCDIEPEEVVVKPLSLVVEQHMAQRCHGDQGLTKLFELELSSAPTEPCKALGILARDGRVHVEDAPVKRRSRHRRFVAHEEFEVGLIPAKLDQL